MDMEHNTDPVNSPFHYSRYRFTCEPKDFTKYLPHPLASAIEYIIRAPYKQNELEDLQKALFWLNELLETEWFWHTNCDGEMKLWLVPLSYDATSIRYRAVAWAMAALSQEVLELVDDDPCVIFKDRVEELVERIKNRVQKLLEKQECKPEKTF